MRKEEHNRPWIDASLSIEEEEEEEGEFTLTEEQFAAHTTHAISKMNADLLEGFVQLSDGDQRAFVLHCANRKTGQFRAGQRLVKASILALLLFEGAKNKGAWGMTQSQHEVAIVPEKEVKKRIANLESQAAAAKKKKKTATAAATNRTTRTKNKQMVKREVKQFYEEDLEAQSKLLDAAFEELVQQQKKARGAKRKAPFAAGTAAARKKKNNNKNNKNAQEEEEEEDTKGALAQRGNQQHLVPLNKMEPLVTVPATAQALSG